MMICCIFNLRFSVLFTLLLVEDLVKWELWVDSKIIFYVERCVKIVRKIDEIIFWKADKRLSRENRYSDENEKKSSTWIKVFRTEMKEVD